MIYILLSVILVMQAWTIFMIMEIDRRMATLDDLKELGKLTAKLKSSTDGLEQAVQNETKPKET